MISANFFLESLKEFLEQATYELIFEKPVRASSYQGNVPVAGTLSAKHSDDANTIEVHEAPEKKFYRVMSDGTIAEAVRPKVFIGRFPNKNPDIYQVAPFITIKLDKCEHTVEGPSGAGVNKITYKVLLDLCILNSHDNNDAYKDLLNLAEKIDLAFMQMPGQVLNQRFKFIKDWSFEVLEDDADQLGWCSGRMTTTWVSFDNFHNAGISLI